MRVISSLSIKFFETSSNGQMCQLQKMHLPFMNRKYSNHLNTGLVRFSNGPNMSGRRMVQFSNGIDLNVVVLISVDQNI